MQVLTYNNIQVFKNDDRPVILGFHTLTLETAVLSNATVSAISKKQTNELLSFEESEALNELDQWSLEQLPNQPTEKSSSDPFSTLKVSALTINVNQICNLACHYCAAGGDGTYGDPLKKISIEKTLPQIKFFFSRLQANDAFSINFLGGEPLLYPEGIDLISEYATELAKEKNIDLKLSITTNGTLLNEKNWEILAKYKLAITISMDGPKEINDKVRPSKNHTSPTEEIEKGLSFLPIYRDQIRKVTLHAVFTKQNMEIEKAYDYFSHLPVDSFEFTFDHEVVDVNLNQLYLDQMQKVANKAYLKNGEKELRRIRFFDQTFQRLDSQQVVRHFCGSGQSYLILDSRNNIYTCPWDVGHKDAIVGTGDQLFMDKLKPYQGSLVEKNSCHSCWIRNMCGGGCMFIHKTATGSKNRVDDLFCERIKSLHILGISYYVMCREGVQNESTNKDNSTKHTKDLYSNSYQKSGSQSCIDD